MLLRLINIVFLFRKLLYKIFKKNISLFHNIRCYNGNFDKVIFFPLLSLTERVRLINVAAFPKILTVNIIIVQRKTIHVSTYIFQFISKLIALKLKKSLFCIFSCDLLVRLHNFSKNKNFVKWSKRWLTKFQDNVWNSRALKKILFMRSSHSYLFSIQVLLKEKKL